MKFPIPFQSKQAGVQVVRWWDLLSALLLLCALLTAASRLVVTHWTEDLYLVQTIVVLGGILGLALGQSRYSPRVVFVLVVAYGLILLPWQLSLTVGGDLDLQGRVIVLLQRLLATMDELVRSRPVTDNILFISLMGLLFFIIAVHAGYSLTRYGQPWRVVLPAGLALMVIHSYDPFVANRAWFLAAYLLFALMLVARMNYIQQRARWTLTRTHTPPDVGFDWIRFTLGVVVVITLFAWTVPALASTVPAASELWQYARRPWVTLQNRMSNAFSALQSSVAVASDYYGNSFSLGRGSTLSDTPVFSVKSPARDFTGGRLYWQAYSYNQYENGQWVSTIQNNVEVDPNNPILSLPSYQGRTQMTFTVSPYIPIATFYTAAQPETLSVPGKVYLGFAPDGTSDVIAWQAQPAITPGHSYDETSSIATMTVAQLKAAGTDYPQWIKDNYLQVPSDITERTRALAAQLANGKSNPYDIANAVTDYLRTYKYVDTVPAPPAHQEVLDWWLFDYKQGFCQYYASAEVMLLRLNGIPARMAVGYAQGQFVPTGRAGQSGNLDPENPNSQPGTFIVRQKDAHAWPEVYFPKYGWVEFEPTASQLAIARPSGVVSNSTGGLLPDPYQNQHGPVTLPPVTPKNEPAQALTPLQLLRQWMVPGLILLAVLALIGTTLFLKRKNIRIDLSPVPIHLEKSLIRLGLHPPQFISRWAAYARLSPVTKSYLEINRALNRLGTPPALQDTPAERAGSLMQLVPATTEPAQHLLSEYQYYVYSNKPVDEMTARQAGKDIRRMSYLAILQRLIARFQEPGGKKSH